MGIRDSGLGNTRLSTVHSHVCDAEASPARLCAVQFPSLRKIEEGGTHDF